MIKLNRKVKCGMLAAVFASLSVFAYSQPSQPLPGVRPSVTENPSGDIPPGPALIHFGNDTSERSIKVAHDVKLSFCVTQGSVKINGWNRNEVRVFVQDGSKFGFQVKEKSLKTDDPGWIQITSIEKKNKYAASECLWGGEIEIDLPLNGTVDLRGQETTTTIDSVKKAIVNTIGGDISLRNITGGITASAGQGDITVEESEGAIVLESTTGNVIVFEAGPSEIGDIFKAKTNGGAISLQKLGYRQVEVNSISGTVVYSGELQKSGSYSFGTSNGSIRLSIPQNSPCTISASYGFGNFTSELPIKILTENVKEGPVKSIVGMIGTGSDASLKLTTNNGSISIKKQ